MPELIETQEQFKAASQEAYALLNGGDPAAAIRSAEECIPGAGQELNVLQLQAAMLTDGGYAVGRRDQVERGAQIWRQLASTDRPQMKYNLANAELALYQLSVHENGLCLGWTTDGDHMRSARSLYEEVGRDTSMSTPVRLRALTNAGNTYDIVGRYLDALHRYDLVLALDPSFGMALGNRGLALGYSAPFMRQHKPVVVREAAQYLDAAIANRESVVAEGGPAAYQEFEKFRARIHSPRSEAIDAPSTAPWSEPYLDWCRRSELFLHVSHRCLKEDTPSLDPVFFEHVTTHVDEPGRNRVRDLVDGFDTIKQEYVAARYLSWLGQSMSSPIRDQATAISKRVSFPDSNDGARWSVRTGMAIQAYAATSNVLDKVASFTHLYLDTERRVRGVYFSRFWCADPSHPKMDPEIAAALSAPEQNLGLLALCDLSRDLESETPLNQRFDQRHAATHRFLVAHSGAPPPSSDWFNRVSWSDLVRESVAQLQVARAAIVYLARLVDRHEKNLELGETSGRSGSISIPLSGSPSPE